VKASSELYKTFLDVFGSEMQKAGFIVKNHMFFKVDMQNKWIKAVFMTYWGGNRLYRICLEILPFTSLFDLKYIRDHVFFDIHFLVRDDVQPNAFGKDPLTFAPFFPTAENITGSFDSYMRFIHSDFNGATTFEECIQYLSKLKKLRRLEEYEEYAMMYAHLYMDQTADAQKFAGFYKDKVSKEYSKMLTSNAQERNGSLSAQLREEAAQLFEMNARNLSEQLQKADEILSCFDMNDVTPLKDGMNRRIELAVNACYCFFTKREQKMLGM